MNKKIFGLFAFGIFALVFALSMVSAVTLANWNFEDSNLVVDSGTGILTLSDSNSRSLSFPAGNAPSANESMSSTGWDVANRYIEISLSTVGYENLILKFDEEASSQGPTAFQIQYSSDGTTFTNFGSLTSTAPNFTANPMHTFDFSTITAIDNNANTKFRVLVPAGSTASSSLGTFKIDNLLIEATSLPITPSEITACNAVGNPGQLEIRKIEFTNKGMQYNDFGKDDEWFILDEIEANIELKNDGNDDIDDVEVSWGLYDTQNNVWVIDYDSEDEFNIKDGDRKTISVSFKLDDDLDVDLEDLNDGDHYKFYVTASGTVDNSTAPQTCVSDFETASIIIESDFVVVDNFQIPETVSCGAKVEVSADVWNIGDSDQDEVSVVATNTELGINEDILVGDMDAFDNQRISFAFEVPKTAQEKTYSIRFAVYDEDGDIYQNDFDEDVSEFNVPLIVKGNCIAPVTELPVTISASLVSGGKAGQDLVVKATLTNSGTQTATYTLSSSGHGQWASSYKVEPQTLTLSAGQSGDAVFTFAVNRDVSGEQTFYIETLSGNQVKRQPVSVTIQKASFLDSITGSAISGISGSSWAWGLGILNVILVIVIIIVAIRVLRK